MPAPKSVRRAARQGVNIGKSPGGSKPATPKQEPEPAKVSEPDAEGLQAKLESLVKHHGIAEILCVLGEISRRSDHAQKQS